MRCNKLGSVCRWLVPVLSAAVLLCACTTQDPPQDPQGGMRISANLGSVHRCSRISPEILVEDAPVGTEYYDVRLMEIYEDAQERFLGGGTWEHDGSGRIPEGVLTRHYRGPCPPAGETRKYAFVVSAMRHNSAQPLAVRIYHFTQE